MNTFSLSDTPAGLNMNTLHAKRNILALNELASWEKNRNLK